MSDDWKAALPEDLQGAPALKDVTDVGSLAKQFVDLQAHMGNTVGLPRTDWTAEELQGWTEKIIEHSDGRLVPKPDLTNDDQSELFFRSLGKPETPDGYQVPEGVDLSGLPEDQVNAIRNRLHDANITDAQWKKLAKHMADDVKTEAERLESAKNNNVDQLKLKWGQNLELKKLELATRLNDLQCPTCFIDDLKADKLAPEMAVFMDKMVGQIGGERRAVGEDPPGTSQLRTPSDIDAEIARLDERKRSQPNDNMGQMEVRRIVEKQHQLRLERDSLK